MTISIRQAIISDAKELTRISFASKRYWNYSEEYFEIWKDELTISEEYIGKHLVYMAEDEETPIGYYSIVHIQQDYWTGQTLVMKGYWLEHMFIVPERIGQGIGSLLMNHIKKICQSLDCDKLFIFADPNARGFYDKMGAIYLKETPSSIPGRTVSVYALPIQQPFTE